MELAGAFGDLGTLVPFVVAYIGVVDMDPLGMLLALGLALVSLRRRLPHPDSRPADEGSGRGGRDPSRADADLTPAIVSAARLATGAVWLVLGLTGAAHRVANPITRPWCSASFSASASPS